MPDFEDLTDQLRIDMAKIVIKAKGKNSDYWEGFRAGKSHARLEVAIITAVLCFGIAAIWRYYA